MRGLDSIVAFGKSREYHLVRPDKSRSLEVSQVGQSLLDHPLLFGRVLEAGLMVAGQGFVAGIVSEIRALPAVAGEAGEGLALDMLGDRQAEPGEDRRGDVAEVGVRGSGRGSIPVPDQATTPSGRWVPGIWGSARPSRTPGRACSAPSMVRRAGRSGRGSLRGRVDAVGRRGVDDLVGKRGSAGLGVSGFERGRRSWRPGRRPPGEGSASGAPGRRSVRVQVDHRRGVLVRGEGQGPLPVERETGPRPTGRSWPSGRRGRRALRPRAGRGRWPAWPGGGGCRLIPGHASDPGVDQDSVGVDPPQARTEAVVAETTKTPAPRRSASSQSSPMARSSLP